ncbi:Dbl homology domain-containing protein [Paraphysoderma sedebokerense]|nr:Dbl homology domain-containing protein [Paraphysoderma sedebokerense]
MSPAILSELSSEEIRRQEAINELVETEYSFSYDMQMVHDCFLEPMKSNGLLSEQEIDEVFSNWTEMMIVSKNLYSALLARVNEEYPIVQFIGDVLLNEISRLKCFASFCGLAQYGVAKLKEKQKIDQNLWEFLHESRRIPHFAKLSIETFLLKPMQRVTKMPLLIKAILKHTPQHHPDYANIFAADRMIADVLNYINNRCGEIQTKRHNEQLMKSLDRDLAKDLGFSLFDYNNSRELIFFSDILYQSRKCTAILFSDLLILASCNKLADKERYNLIRWFNLWCLEIKNIGNLETVSGSDSSRSSLSEGTVGRRVSRTFQNFMLDPDELARSIHFYDIPTDSLIEMRLQTSEEKRKFADRLSAAICFLHKASRFELFNLHSLNHYPFQTWKCATSFGGLVLLGSDQAMWYGREDSLQNQALPGHRSSSLQNRLS